MHRVLFPDAGCAATSDDAEEQTLEQVLRAVEAALCKLEPSALADAPLRPKLQLKLASLCAEAAKVSSGWDKTMSLAWARQAFDFVHDHEDATFYEANALMELEYLAAAAEKFGQLVGRSDSPHSKKAQSFSKLAGRTLVISGLKKC